MGQKIVVKDEETLVTAVGKTSLKIIPTGAQGVPGPQGPPGPTGPTGPQPDLSDAPPEALGVASPGVDAEASRSDHVHPLPSPGDVGAATAAQGSLADSAVQPGDLATVATSGDYDDLSNKPTIPPAAPVDSVNGETGVVVLDATDVGAVPTARTITAGTGLTGGGDLSADRTLTVTYGATAGTAAEGNDARLTNARTPTAHAASHQDGGSDELALDGSQITSGTVAAARLGSGTASAGTVLSSTGTSTSWDVTSGAGSPWTPISGASYLIPEGITNPSPAVGIGTGCIWSWRHTRGPWAITSLGIYIVSVGATPGQYRLHLHLMGPSGKPGDLLWVAPSVYTASTNATLAIVNLASPVTVPAGHTFGVGVQQIVASSTTTIQHAPMKQEPEGAVTVAYTNNTYGWVASGTSPLGSAPTVSTQQLNQVPKILVGIA